MILLGRMTCRVRLAMMPMDRGGSVHRRFGGVRVLIHPSHFCSYTNILLAFLTVPSYSFFLSLRNHSPLNRKETVRLHWS